MGSVSTDAWSPSPPVVQGNAAEMLVSAGAGPDVVWLVYLFFFFFFFFCFSSFFSSASLERKDGREVRKKVSKMFKPVDMGTTEEVKPNFRTPPR
jgi:hypothetical protein